MAFDSIHNNNNNNKFAVFFSTVINFDHILFLKDSYSFEKLMQNNIFI